MACGISFRATATSTGLLLLVLLQAALVWDEAQTAPAKRNDILAGTEFLSVFINGAMATPPQRRRGFRRGGGHSSSASDSATAESQQHEASIYRISRNPGTRQHAPRSRNPAGREEVVRFYPISQKSLENGQQNLASLIDELSTTGDLSSTRLAGQTSSSATTAAAIAGGNSTGKAVSSQKVIGVSVTSTVEATPYKVRVEHYDDVNATAFTRPPGSSTRDFRNVTTRTSTVGTATTSTPITPSSSSFVTEELSNIVSESNRSEFSLDEASPGTGWKSSMTPGPSSTHASTTVPSPKGTNASSPDEDTITLPSEENFQLPEKNQESLAVPAQGLQAQGRKAGRHYDPSNYNRPPSRSYKSSRPFGDPPKLYSEPAKVYGEPEKVYSEPAKVYSEPAKVYSEPAKVYSEPAKVYSEPAKVYGEPEKVYSEPAKVYSEPAKVYGEASKVYHAGGQSLASEREPDEQNYEVDESVSVSSNGNVHGPRLMLTEPSNASEVEDGHKVGYVVEGRNYRKYRVEERTPDGFIVGEYGVVSHDDGSLRGVRYTADGTINPRLIYDALMKFLAL